ncbi:MAG: hypothetical protein AB8C13_05505 [Phycisphaerales bacterium]
MTQAPHSPSQNLNESVINTTIVTSANPSELSELEAAIMDACNELHTSREMQDQAGIEIFTSTLLTLLDSYDATDGDHHPNPAWARPNQRALAYSAMGDLERAIALEMTALKYADSPRRQEISNGNIADRLIRIGDPQAAIEFFLDAHQHNPDSIPVLLTGAVAVYEAGYEEQAETIFNTILVNPQLLIEGSELAAYLDLDARTRRVAMNLDSGLKLLSKLHSMRAQSGDRS